MRNELMVHVTGSDQKRKKLMKILEKAKVRFTRIRTITDDDGNEFYDVQFHVKEKKFWHIYRKLELLGDLTIE